MNFGIIQQNIATGSLRVCDRWKNATSTLPFKGETIFLQMESMAYLCACVSSDVYVYLYIYYIIMYICVKCVCVYVWTSCSSQSTSFADLSFSSTPSRSTGTGGAEGTWPWWLSRFSRQLTCNNHLPCPRIPGSPRRLFLDSLSEKTNCFSKVL